MRVHTHVQWANSVCGVDWQPKLRISALALVLFMALC